MYVRESGAKSRCGRKSSVFSRTDGDSVVRRNKAFKRNRMWRGEGCLECSDPFGSQIRERCVSGRES